jgi:hypothetical protein
VIWSARLHNAVVAAVWRALGERLEGGAIPELCPVAAGRLEGIVRRPLISEPFVRWPVFYALRAVIVQVNGGYQDVGAIPLTKEDDPPILGRQQLPADVAVRGGCLVFKLCHHTVLRVGWLGQLGADGRARAWLAEASRRVAAKGQAAGDDRHANHHVQRQIGPRERQPAAVTRRLATSHTTIAIPVARDRARRRSSQNRRRPSNQIASLRTLVT